MEGISGYKIYAVYEVTCIIGIYIELNNNCHSMNNRSLAMTGESP